MVAAKAATAAHRDPILSLQAAINKCQHAKAHCTSRQIHAATHSSNVAYIHTEPGSRGRPKDSAEELSVQAKFREQAQ